MGIYWRSANNTRRQGHKLALMRKLTETLDSTNIQIVRLDVAQLALPLILR